MSRAALASLTLVLLLAACGASAGSQAPKTLPLPDPTDPPTPTPAPGAIVACPPSDLTLSNQFESPYPPPVPIPSTLPATLPADPVPATANIYAVGVPADPATSTPAWLYYLVGPAAAPCVVDIGDYRQVDATQSAGEYVTAFFPGAADEALTLVCAYIAAAKTVLKADGGDPADCIVGGGPGGTGEEVVALGTGVVGASLAGVIEPVDKGIPGSRTVVLYAFALAADGTTYQSADIECGMPKAKQAVCTSTFAFFLAQLSVTAGWGLTSATRAELVSKLAGALAAAG